MQQELRQQGRGLGMANDNDKVMRHAGIDRLFHWVTAATMTVLLATSLLPIVGVRFAWYQIHWIAGIVLTVAILLHIIRALFWQRLRTITLRAADLSGKPAGKYTVAQKLMHLGWTVAVLVGDRHRPVHDGEGRRSVPGARPLCVFPQDLGLSDPAA